MREQDYYFHPLLLFLSHAKFESVFIVILMSQKTNDRVYIYIYVLMLEVFIKVFFFFFPVFLY